MNSVVVQKREGGEEPWSFDKLVASLGKAGVPVDSAEEIAGQIETWAQDHLNKGRVTSTQIRDKVIELLSPLFPAEAESYKIYKKP